MNLTPRRRSYTAAPRTQIRSNRFCPNRSVRRQTLLSLCRQNLLTTSLAVHLPSQSAAESSNVHRTRRHLTNRSYTPAPRTSIHSDRLRPNRSVCRPNLLTTALAVHFLYQAGDDQSARRSPSLTPPTSKENHRTTLGRTLLRPVLLRRRNNDPVCSSTSYQNTLAPPFTPQPPTRRHTIYSASRSPCPPPPSSQATQRQTSGQIQL